MTESSAKESKKPSPTKGFGPPPITKSTAETDRDGSGQFLSGSRPSNKRTSLSPSDVGRRFGRYTVTSAALLRCPKGYAKAQVTCDCGISRIVDLNSLLRGASQGCPACRAKRTKSAYPAWLRNRVVQQRQRCQNSDDPGYKTYGGRGIEFRFPSTEAACTWIMENLGLHKHLTLDRIDNSGHYEAGNLRWATCSEQLNNTRRSRLKKDFDPNEWPYSRIKVIQFLREGFTREQILQKAHQAVAEKRKNWRGIQAKLASMTS